MRILTPEQHAQIVEALENSEGLVQNELEGYESLYGQYPTRASKIKSMREGLENHLAALTVLQALPELEVVATQWLQHGVMVNAFPRIPESPEVYDPDGSWGAKGYSKAPLYATKEPS